MNSISSVFDRLGQVTVPNIAARAFPDTMTIYEDVMTTGTGGGQIKSSLPAWEEVPVAYEPAQSLERRVTSGEKNTSVQRYRLTFPTHWPEAERISLDPAKHRFVTDVRGNEPQKTFRLISLRDDMGVCFEAVCERID